MKTCGNDAGISQEKIPQIIAIRTIGLQHPMVKAIVRSNDRRDSKGRSPFGGEAAGRKHHLADEVLVRCENRGYVVFGFLPAAIGAEPQHVGS